jgi:hypothetical protein
MRARRPAPGRAARRVLGRDGWPRATLFAGAALALTFPASRVAMSDRTAESLRYCVTYLAWALPLAVWLAMALPAPRRLERCTRLLHMRLAPALTAAGS